MEASSEASYCERETWEDWGSRSSLSHVEEVATHSSGRDDLATLRAERDALARALAGERQRAATAARAHDARLAELHGVIAELVRRRAQDKHAGAIPEEELSDECESTTQPAGELDNDADMSRTEQNDTSSALSPAELPTPQESKLEPQEPPAGPPHQGEAGDAARRADIGAGQPRREGSPPAAECGTSLDLSRGDSDVGLTTARCCRGRSAGGGSAERAGAALCTGSTGRCESRQAKIASRVRLRKTEDSDSSHQVADEESWCAEAAERLALDVCAQADLREALVAANNDGSALAAGRARCARLEADVRVLQCALARATDTAHRLYTACAAQESTSVSLCCALRAADRALETYDVLLALAETQPAAAAAAAAAAAGDTRERYKGSCQRAAAELVARQLLARLEAERAPPGLGEPLLPPGPWLAHHATACGAGWSADGEARLRRHAARLKADTVALRGTQPPPQLFSYHDVDEEEVSQPAGGFSMCEMEAAVALQDALAAAELRHAHKVSAAAHAGPLTPNSMPLTPAFPRREFIA